MARTRCRQRYRSTPASDKTRRRCAASLHLSSGPSPEQMPSRRRGKQPRAPRPSTVDQDQHALRRERRLGHHAPPERGQQIGPPPDAAPQAFPRGRPREEEAQGRRGAPQDEVHAPAQAPLAAAGAVSVDERRARSAVGALAYTMTCILTRRASLGWGSAAPRARPFGFRVDSACNLRRASGCASLRASDRREVACHTIDRSRPKV